MEPPQKNSVSLGFPAMDWQGPAARRAGIVLLLLVCIALGIAIAGIPSSAGDPRLIVVQVSPSSSSPPTDPPTTTSRGPSTPFGSAPTVGRTPTPTRRSTPTTARKTTPPAPKPT